APSQTGPWRHPVGTGRSSASRLLESALPPDHREPRPRPTLAERDALKVGADLVPGRTDLLHGPAVRKGIPDLLLRDPPRPLGAGLLLAEAQQEEPPARFRDMGQPGDVASPVLVGEDVEQAAVDHALEPPVEPRERQAA